MPFDPKFHIGREEYYVPSTSSYLWDNADTINDLYGEAVFAVLIEKKQHSNDPNYYFSAATAYDNSALERVAEPLRSALRHKIDATNLAEPNSFISFADLDAMKFPQLRLLTAQWVIFNQDPFTQDAPSLSISRDADGTYYDLPALVVTGWDDFSGLHTRYTLIANSMASQGDYTLAGLYNGYDDVEERHAQMKARVPDLRCEFGLRSVDEFSLVELEFLNEATLGIVPRSTTVFSDDGEKHTIESFSIDDGVKLNFAIFGLIKPPRQEMIVHFPDPAIRPLRYYPDGARMDTPSEPVAMSGMLRHILDILEEHGTWPKAPRPTMREKTRDLLGRLRRNILGNGE